MGLFSSKKKVYVASVAYNMAGDEDDRPSYIKSLLLKYVVSGSKEGIPATLFAGYFHGPQIDLRAFYRWAKTNYTTVGMPPVKINGYDNINNLTIAGQISHAPTETVYIQYVEVIIADHTAWGEQWMLENYPDLYDTEWTADYDEDTGDILITFADETTTTFTPVGFERNAEYLYILYSLIVENDPEATETGPTITLAPGDNFPSTTGWTAITNVIETINQPLDKVTTTEVSYSDGRPTETTTTTDTTTESYSSRNSHYQRQESVGQDPDSDNTRIISTQYDMYFITNGNVSQTTTVTETEEDVDGVTVTTKVTVVQDVLSVVRQHRTDTTDTVLTEFKDAKLWLYKIGSGNTAMDDMIANPVQQDDLFFPCLPVRINNKFISDSYYPELYTQTTKAYKKLMKKKFTELIDKVEDNEKLSDIDHAFVTFGVSLNVKEKACKKYLYKFLHQLMDYQNYDQADLGKFIDDLAAYDALVQQWEDFRNGLTNEQPADLFKISQPIPKSNQIQIKSEGTVNIPYDIRLQWNAIREVMGTGLGKPDAVKGDIWLETRPDYTWNTYVVKYLNNRDHHGETSTITTVNRIEVMRIYWQTEDNAFKYIEVYGFKHINYVYGGSAVITGSKEALADEDESGFVVPLHYGVMKRMSLMDSTQMTTACIFIVFNCYLIKKIKWYQRGIFKILFVIVFAIVSAVFTGGAGFGLLGANISVGSALGFSGLTAAIAGSVVNALAAVILTQVVSFASTLIFGEKFGALIGAILSFVIFNVAISFQQTGIMGIDWGSMMKAENLLKLTDALSQGYSGYINGVTQDIMSQTKGLQTSYESRSKEISDLWGQNIGYTDIAFNPGWITNSHVSYFYEGSSLFLSRTLMTGSDIADMSLDMLTNYVDINLTLPTLYT